MKASIVHDSGRILEQAKPLGTVRVKKVSPCFAGKYNLPTIISFTEALKNQFSSLKGKHVHSLQQCKMET